MLPSAVALNANNATSVAAPASAGAADAARFAELLRLTDKEEAGAASALPDPAPAGAPNDKSVAAKTPTARAADEAASAFLGLVGAPSANPASTAAADRETAAPKAEAAAGSKLSISNGATAFSAAPGATSTGSRAAASERPALNARGESVASLATHDPMAATALSDAKDVGTGEPAVATGAPNAGATRRTAAASKGRQTVATPGAAVVAKPAADSKTTASVASGATTASQTTTTTAASIAPIPAAVMQAMAAGARTAVSEAPIKAATKLASADAAHGSPALRETVSSASVASRAAKTAATSGKAEAKNTKSAPAAVNEAGNNAKAQGASAAPDAAKASSPGAAAVVAKDAGHGAEMGQPVSETPPSASAAAQLAGGVGAHVSETRVALSSAATAQAAAVVPSLALRVHTVGGATRAIEIRLDPAELGAVNVKLSKDSQGRLTAIVSADRVDSFDLLKGDATALHAALQNAGVGIAEDAISFQLNDQGAGSGEAFQREAAAYGGSTARRDEAAADLIGPAAGAWRNGVVDISV